METSRRDLLALAGMAPLMLLAGRATAADAPCYNPATLSLTQKNLRTSVGFAEASTDPKRHCGLCAFFTPGKGSCGTCQIMSGSPVTTAGVCTSFAPKAG